MTKQQCIQHVQLVSKNRTNIKPEDKPLANTPDAAYQVLRDDWDNDTINLLEEFKLMSLDSQMRLTSIATISKGGMSGTLVDLKILFSTALLSKAHSIIVAHNHPSGTLVPSSSDIALTEKILEAGKVIDIPLKDHIIVTDQDYCSLHENDLVTFH